jgi:alkanesulfonate monooxygenase SsuD/methylene tetrahydromethanopterin reductase-like flavin-dependent oxidoreductase (luciferase family)
MSYRYPCGVDAENLPRSVTRLGLWLSDPISAPGTVGVLESASAVAGSAERAGFDSLWLGDRVPGIADPRGAGFVQGADRGGYEAYSLLGALATRTHSIRLGAIPIQSDRRAPSIVTKIVTGLDIISHGRGVVTVGFESEDGVNGVNRLEEGLQVCRAMLDDEDPKFVGRFYQIDGAMNRPRAVQAGGVPLVVLLDRGDGDLIPNTARVDAMRIAARYADAVVVSGGPTSVEEAVAIVRTTSSSRDWRRSFRRSVPIEVIWLGTVLVDEAGSATPGGWLSGSPARVAEEVGARLRAGADGCIVSLAGNDLPEAIAGYGSVLGETVRSVRDQHDRAWGRVR